MCHQGELSQFYVRIPSKFALLRRPNVWLVWKMPRFTGLILSHYKDFYCVVLRRPPFPYCCYSSCILLSWYERQCLSGLSWLLPTQSFYREAHEQKSMKIIVSCRLCYQSQMGMDIFKHYSWFSKLRNSLSQIPLTCREFGCPVPIMALGAPPNICAMVSGHLGVLAPSQ